MLVLPPGRGLLYETDRDACRLAGVPGKAPIFYAAKVSFRVPRRNAELRIEEWKTNFLLNKSIQSMIMS